MRHTPTDSKILKASSSNTNSTAYNTSNIKFCPAGCGSARRQFLIAEANLATSSQHTTAWDEVCINPLNAELNPI